MRHSKDKWQRLEAKAASRVEHFVPFYHKENASLLREKNDNPITFPNYMNWYNQEDDKASSPPIPPKPASRSVNKLEKQKDLYQQHKADYFYRPSYGTGGRTYQESNSDEQNLAQRQSVFDKPDVDDQRQMKLKRLREELKEYQEYQLRRPFQPSEVPSTWQSNRESHKQARSKNKHSLHIEETQSEVTARPAISTNQPSDSETSAPKRGHLNRGLQSIMAEESKIGFDKNAYRRQSGQFSYFPGQENKDRAPFLTQRDKQSNQGNGDFK
ncbi:hypothetical protein EF384_05410 [Aerococcus agrisoli]|uniref:Uncharacterized protein n=2 Tax=Aerococcus agrisoli TaxID=2487350 RepID=A0A3N4GCK9_9LACT|nr:hypothetical protein EF384_05410 [Aerococcus agrisoli]